MINRRQLALQTAALAAASVAGLPVRAQGNKPISLLVGYSAGGSADFVARVVTAEMSKRLGRQIIIENVAGASGMLAAQKAVNTAADGSVIYMGGTDTVVIPMVNPRIKLDWDKDYAPVGRMSSVPMVFAVPANAPYATLAELVADLHKTKSDHFSYATPGVGTMQHLYGALINKRAQVSMLHIPYRGGAQIANDLVGRQVDSAMLVLSTAMPFLKEGKIKALSVSDTARVPSMPQVKAIGEEPGFAGVALPLWQGLFVKAGTPAALTASYEKALLESLAQDDVQKKLMDSGVTTAPLTGPKLHEFIRPQALLYKDIVESAKISLE